MSLFGTKYTLPEGTERWDNEDFEEITIPKTKAAAKTLNETPVLISSLDPYAQKAFPGYTSLNRIQSIVFPVAYASNENMLVCAPTGAVSWIDLG